MNLKLGTRMIEGIMVVDCHGRIIFGDESLMLRETVKEQLKTAKDIVINLADVNYVDSGGLGTLVGLFTSARAIGGNIKLANLTHRVGELLQVTKLLTVFEVYDGEDKAVRSFPKKGAVA
ncbi:MAG: STAS domain-containing protein [Terriglobales bacterium]|jgi:anti-sigma B factor antagonist